MPEFTLKGPAAMKRWGRQLARLLEPGDVVALVGDLGAGKTTLVQGIARGWGFRGEVSSPTFALANEYLSRRGRLVHMDMYRLTPAELKAFPLEDYFGDGVCLVEWADRVKARWPAGTLQLKLSAPRPDCRRLVFRLLSSAWKKRLAGWAA